MVKKEVDMSRIWELKWHSKRTGMEGTTKWPGKSADEVKENYERIHQWREVKVVTEITPVGEK